ncbi:MAG: hypothetical protein SFV81_10200 [Pirellulaceae bacterium]|nr:hypothetical protein [Pirellulaceae bacterium]
MIREFPCNRVFVDLESTVRYGIYFILHSAGLPARFVGDLAAIV